MNNHCVEVKKISEMDIILLGIVWKFRFYRDFEGWLGLDILEITVEPAHFHPLLDSDWGAEFTMTR